jgi:cyclopropane-fatty-acyl-phospholipid synthase
MNTHTHPAETISQNGLWSRLVAGAFSLVLDRLDRGVVAGSIDAILPDGSQRILGGRGAGPQAVLIINRWNALLRMFSGGSVGGYEGWERNEWESPDLVTLFDVFMRNRVTLGGTARASGLSRMMKRFAHSMHRNDRQGAKRNIMAHYDLGNDFYACWLDKTMSYSSARFVGDETLEAAQARKVDMLAARLSLVPKSRVLEIGCGWGHVSGTLSELGHNVTAITISPAQKLYAETHNIGPDYQLCDYRDVTGTYDAVVSIEMVEAVGQDYWGTYLDVIARSLKPGGRAAVQFITINDDVFDRYASSADFIQTYIFPGGMLLSESRFRALAEARGFTWEAPEYFGLDYAQTLAQWRGRYEAAIIDGHLPAHFDDKFTNLWRFYLMYCEGGFRGGGIDVGQVTLVIAG